MSLWFLAPLLILGAVSSATAQYPDSVVATIPVGGDPTDIAVLPSGDFAYVAHELADYITVVNVRTRAIVTLVYTGSCSNMVSATPDGAYVYVTHGPGNRVVVVRTSDNSVVTSIPVGSSPHRLNVTRDGTRVYVANQNSNSVSVIRTSDNTVIATVPVGRTPRDVDCLPNGEYAYAVHIYEPTMAVIRTSDHTVVRYIQLGFNAHRVYTLPGNEYVYATEYQGPRIAVVRASDHTVVATLNTGERPCGMCSVNDGEYLFVAGGTGQTVHVIRTADNVTIARITTVSTPMSVRNAADDSYVASSNRGTQTVSIIARRTRHDVGPVQVLAPAGTIDSGAVITPRVAARNFGTFDEVFPLTLLIGGNYGETITESLPAGATDTFQLPDWTAGPSGILPVMCFTGLAPDENRSNDTISATVRVIPGPVRDVGATAILAPSGTVDSGSVHLPAALVRNFGTTDEVFPVSFSIGLTYAETVVETLAAGASDTVRFAPWTALRPGTFPVVCFTGLEPDENRTNDTVVSSVQVLPGPVRDVGTIAIIAPSGTVDSGSVHLPAALVRNFGTTDEVFPVSFSIGLTYAETVVETLAAGRTDTVRFAPWTALRPGTFPVVCFTGLAGDADPSNDTLQDSVRVRSPGRHDVGTTAILRPLGTARTGDTLRPVAVIRNFGSFTERYFDVVFSIGAGYRNTVTVSTPLLPDSSLELVFGRWTALSGTHAVSCSTMLTVDADKTNDKVTSSVRVSRPSVLVIEPDIADRIRPGEIDNYLLWAELDADSGDIVRLVLPEESANPGWSAGLFDSSGTQPITNLGYLAPSERRCFTLKVTATESRDDSARVGRFRVRGFLAGDTATSDTAVVTLTLLAGLEIHNVPNPFWGSTVFHLVLPEDGRVSLTVFNRAGECVRRVLSSTALTAGLALLDWDAKNDQGRPVAPGTYQYLLEFTRAGKTDRILKKLVISNRM